MSFSAWPVYSWLFTRSFQVVGFVKLNPLSLPTNFVVVEVDTTVAGAVGVVVGAVSVVAGVVVGVVVGVVSAAEAAVAKEAMSRAEAVRVTSFFIR
ncbi:hypothetical protein CDO73_25670 [Saccharibacillus sp. O23]|nr:hypothetical protein CDO73_25670 [Saccharibacillus sp. O23]